MFINVHLENDDDHQMIIVWLQLIEIFIIAVLIRQQSILFPTSRADGVKELLNTQYGVSRSYRPS